MKKIMLIGAAILLAACVERTTSTEPTPTAPQTTAEVCGGIAGKICSNAADYCHHAEGVCLTTADAQGECKVKPEACTKEFIPVCGCDGANYGNACMAHAAGTSIASQGKCPESE